MVSKTVAFICMAFFPAIYGHFEMPRLRGASSCTLLVLYS